MGTRRVDPGTDVPAIVVVLHASERTRVTRLTHRGRAVVLKEPLGPGADHRLRRELAMLERVRGSPGVAQLLEEPRYPGRIPLADAGTTTLAARTATPGAAELLRLASALAQAVSALHRRLVMHLDIQPSNIVISRSGAPCLVDFALARTFDVTRHVTPRHGDIEGTLAYLAPELTGRAGRPVDQRADLYALGATLYELATGMPPFGAGDPLRLVHDHLARVPVPPVEIDPALPGELSEIVMHLLEKEPDNRYQTADGLLHDLERLRPGRAEPGSAAEPVGLHDVPSRLTPPSRLVGRDAELAALDAALQDCVAGGCSAVLVSGAPGVGKTALLDALRPVVRRRGGWFVAGKFDQYRRDVEASGVSQGFRALARLLLAEPEDELADVRERIRAALGPNAGLMAAVVPEYSALLGVAPDPGDPATAQARGSRNGVEILRAVASPQRPLVYFVDDLQWAASTPLGFIDMLLDEGPIPGLLLLGSYRDHDGDAADPLAERLARWRARPGVRHVRLGNLPTRSLVTMVAEMLHTDPATATGLVEAMEPHTSGNPYETVELLDGLRRDGVLTATPAGWTWDEGAARLRLTGPETERLFATPVAALPPRSRALVEAMACLGGRTTTAALATATGEPAAVVDQLLAPAIREGVLVAEGGADDAVRFAHDRIHEAILRGLDPHRRRELKLAMARRLARVPELLMIAAEQYLPVTDAIDDPAERRAVVDLLRQVADHARRVAANEARVVSLLTAALPLVDPQETATLAEIHLGRQTALYRLGRLDEADADYRAVRELDLTAVQRAEAAAVQVRTLTNRNRFGEAVELGVTMLRELGIAVPAHRSPDELRAQVAHLHRWLDRTDVETELERPELTDPTLLAAARLMASLVPVTYFVPDFPLFLWLTMEGPRIWLEHGPHPTVLGLTGVAANAPRLLDNHDYALGYRALRLIIAVGDARGYEPETSLVRSTFSSTSCSWFEPLEDAVRAAQQARRGLVAGGDLAWAGYAYLPSVAGLLDCAPTLEVYAAEVDDGLAFLRRTGNEQAAQWLAGYQWLAEVLRGESGDATAAVHEPLPLDLFTGNPAALLYGHLARAVAAAVLDDRAGLVRHSDAVMELLATITGLYPTAVAHLLHGLVLAEQARAADGRERETLLLRLDDVTRWLAERAEHAPDNFRHLLRLVEAERAWATGDFRTAVLTYDAALSEVDSRVRPWHRALIAERAAHFHLAHGAGDMGRSLVARAREAYAAWGATAKVSRLDWAHPGLPGGGGTPPSPGQRAGDVRARRPPMTTGTLDLLGVLTASQAISSETSIERLHTRVVDVLSAMTGATGVHLLLWSDERQAWLTTPDAGSDGAGRALEVPTSVLRYVQRVREPLVVEDATRDDRFAHDPYFIGVAACSVLALPIVGRGSLRAVLLLENRLIRGAFTTERLDAVELIAGQLTVSLDNAQLYAELAASRARIVAAADQTRRRIERDLHDGAQQRLVALGLQARLAHTVLPPGSEELAALLDTLAVEADKASEELRELAQGIHPAVLAEGGLRPALRVLARRSAVPVSLQLGVTGRLPEHAEIAVYFVVAEALTNVAKHARASTADVTVEAAGDAVRVQVRDDGRGGADVGAGSGLIGLKDRVEALGGGFSVRSVPGAGTTLQADLPFAPPRAVPD
jgi:predicted ATPase/signal transduction histidine kinase